MKQEFRREVNAVDLVELALAHALTLQDGPPKGGGTPARSRCRRSVELDLAHSLAVTDVQGQHGARHAAAVDDVAVEEQVRVGDDAGTPARTDAVDLVELDLAHAPTLQDGPPKGAGTPARSRCRSSCRNRPRPCPGRYRCPGPARSTPCRGSRRCRGRRAGSGRRRRRNYGEK